MTHFRNLESQAAVRREQEFQKWRLSGYRDTAAYEAFINNFVLANHFAAKAQANGEPRNHTPSNRRRPWS